MLPVLVLLFSLRLITRLIGCRCAGRNDCRLAVLLGYWVLGVLVLLFVSQLKTGLINSSSYVVIVLAGVTLQSLVSGCSGFCMLYVQYKTRLT